MSNYEINVKSANGRQSNWIACKAEEIAGKWRSAKVCNRADDTTVTLQDPKGQVLITETYIGGAWRPIG